MLFAGICRCAAGQDADTRWLIIPRAEANVYAPLSRGGDFGADGGMTSLYALLEGGWGEHVTYSSQLHLLSVDPLPLYKNSFRSNGAVWMDWLYLGFHSGDWEFRLGKDFTAIGTIELDAYDFENLFNLSGSAYNRIIFAQWRASVCYKPSAGRNLFQIQALSSPFGSHLFPPGPEQERTLFSFSGRWRGNYESVTTINSLNLFEYAPGRFIQTMALGALVQLGKGWNAGVDFMTRGRDHISHMLDEGTLMCTFGYNPSEKMSLTLKFGYEYSNGSAGFFTVEDGPGSGYAQTNIAWQKAVLGKNYLFGGFQAVFRPFESIPNLRLHFCGAYNNYAQRLSMTLGGVYYLDLYPLISGRARAL